MHKFFGAALVAGAVALSLGGAAEAKTFRYATTGDVLGLDPHINNEGPTNTMKNNIYEGLIHRGWDLSLHPGLATEWEQVNPTTWRFKLRQGVKFHDGSDFNADDVLFSFERIKQPQSEMSFAVNTITEIKKINDFEIELITGGPDPILLLNLPNFHIMDKQWAEKNNTVTVERGSTAKTFANLNTNGTGPFKLVSWVPDTKLEVETNAGWWGKPTHNLTKAVFTPIGNDATRVAALLSGEIDAMYPVPLQDVQRINSSSNAKVLQGPELRTIFLGFDQHREESLDMPGTGKNPFKDKRVRQAFYQAIDMEAIRRVVMRGASANTALMIAPGINGFDKALNDRYPYDPEAAKKLLAEAGYPNGFPVTLDCPNDRYVNDEAICLGVVPMIKRIGVDIKLNAQNKSLHFDKIGLKQGNNTSFYMLGWTPGSYDALNMLENIITLDGKGQGTWNSGRYTNPRVEELTDLIRVETNQEKRNAMISEAMKIHKEDFGHLPLHQQALAWGVASTVADIKQRPQNDIDLRYVTLK